MSTKYFVRDINEETECDSTGPLDISLLRGISSVNLDKTTTNMSFEEVWTADMDVTRHATPPAGLNTMNMSVDFHTVPANAEARFRATTVDEGCNEIAMSAYSSTVSAAGIATLSAGLLGANMKRLRLSIEIRSTNGLSAQVRINVNDSDTFIEAPWTYLSRRQQIITACLERLQSIDQLADTGTILVEDEDALTPSAHLWAVSETKAQRTTGSRGGSYSSEFRMGVRVVDKDIDALDNMAELMKIIEIAVTGDPKQLGLDFVEWVFMEEAIAASTSEEIGAPYGLAELVFLVQYNQLYGVP